MRQFLSNLSFGWLRATGGGRGLRILMYHRVTDAHPDDRLCVSTLQFAAQMAWLRQEGYRTVTYAEATRYVAERESLPERSIVLTFDDGYEDNFRFAYPVLQQCRFTGMFFIPTKFLKEAGEGRLADDRPMSLEQLKTLARDGHEIGAHSVSHKMLTCLAPEELQCEVRDCKVALEQGVGHSIDYFCYPAGDHNDAVKAAVRAAGYHGACTVKPGANHPGMDVFALRRTEIGGFDSLWDFQKKLAGAFDWMHVLAQTKAGYGQKTPDAHPLK